MKKLSTLFVALIATLSVFAGEIVLAPADFTLTDGNAATEVSQTAKGVTLKYYGRVTQSDIRVNALQADNKTANELTISYGSSISKVVIVGQYKKSNGTDEFAPTAAPGTLSVEAGAKEGDFYPLTITVDAINATSFTISVLKQLKVSEITLTVDGEVEGGDQGGNEGGDQGGNEGGDQGGNDPVNPSDTLTVAQAITIAQQQGSTASAETYIVKGYVTKSLGVNTKYNDVSLFIADTPDGGQDFEFYAAKMQNGEPKVGDLVVGVGNILMYNQTPELNKGCTVEILKAAEGGNEGGDQGGNEPPVAGSEISVAEFIAAADAQTEYILTGTVSDIWTDNATGEYNVYGNFDLTDATGTILVYGLLTVDGQSKQFATMGIDAGDVVTLKGVYTTYNGEPQIKNATYISHVDAGEGGEGGEEGDTDYSWEPTEVTTINKTFTQGGSYESYEGIVDFYVEDDTDALELYFISNSTTGVPAGTYSINASGEEGTVYASPGGDIFYDYPSVYLANIEYVVDEEGEGYLWDAYYIVSGTVTVTGDNSNQTIVVAAKSYNGSTLNITYTGLVEEWVDEETAVENVTTTESSTRKVFQGGHIYIIRDNVKYNLLGTQVK